MRSVVATIDPIWDQLHKKGWGKYPAESIVQFLVRYKQAAKDFKSHNKILDLGCGGGANTKMMIAEGYDVVAVDGSPNAVKHAKEYVGKGALITVVDANTLAKHFAPESFDIVVDNATISCATIKNIKNILSQVSTLLKKGGLFFSTCISPYTSGSETGILIEPGTYTGIKEGCLANRGMIHVSTEKEIRNVYGSYFTLRSIDTHEYTEFNKKRKVGLLESIWVK